MQRYIWATSFAWCGTLIALKNNQFDRLKWYLSYFVVYISHSSCTTKLCVTVPGVIFSCLIIISRPVIIGIYVILIGFFRHAGNDLRTRCSSAIEVLQRARVGRGTGKGTGKAFTHAFIQERRRSAFPLKSAQKCPRVSSWTHRFVCLSQCHQETIPTTEKDKDALLEAGLGEKRIVIPDVNSSAEDFRGVLYEAYPKLKYAGGFLFAKCRSNSRELEILPSLCLTSPRILQDRVGNARTYILPMQRNLDVSAVCNLSSGVSLGLQDCHYLNRYIHC